nr:1-phosphofructokinase [Lachnospiraceae bacterium]
MIYTVTFNPSLDYIVSVPDFKIGVTNRTASELIYPGGKGINVSLVLKNFGIDSVALGFTAGFTGDEIKRLIDLSGIKADFIPVSSGISRINVKLRGIEETEINGIGPAYSDADIDKLYEKLDRLKSGDFLILSGSIPPSLPSGIYMDILSKLNGRGIRYVVDASGELLTKVLDFKPFLIKPNKQELEGIFGCHIENNSDSLACARKLQAMGASNVLVSLAGDGALLLSENGDVYESLPPQGTLVNSVGAGDSMIAGFIIGYL